MIRRPHLFFRAIQVPVDAIAVYAAAIAAYHLRLTDFFTQLRPVTFDLTLSTYSNVAGVAVLLWILVFTIGGLYRTSYRPLGRELVQLLLASASAMAIVFAFLFFSLEAFESRFIVLAGWALAIVFIWAERIALRSIENSLRYFGIGVKRAVVIGDNDAAKRVHAFYTHKLVSPIEIVGTYKSWSKKTQSNIEKFLKSGAIDVIYLFDQNVTHKDLSDIQLITDAHHAELRYSADLFSVGSLRMEAQSVAGVPMIKVKKSPLEGWGAIYKRIFDIVISLLLIITTSPFLLLIAIIILIESGFPVLFKNTRVGEGGSTFATLKFRSMKAEYSIGPQKGLGNQKKAKEIEEQLIKAKSKKQGPVYKIMEDPRVTPFGRFIRKFSLDELPQLFNILRGEMSLVGPRPHQPREVDKYTLAHRKVLNIRPGLTGMAQISGRSDLEFDEEVTLDTFYIENWSVWLDFVILIKTPFVVIFRKGAY